MAAALQLQAAPSAAIRRAATAPRPAPQRPACSEPAVPAFLQRAGLKVSSPHDAAEREAVATARAIMGMAAPQSVGRANAAVQRAATRPVRAVKGGAPNPTLALGGGMPLPASVRRYMEPRFGADFGAVRMYADDRAAALARAFGARAFATGGAVVFGRGQFRPDTSEGRELIAHELTHVIQQGAAVQRLDRASLPAVRRSSTGTLLRAEDGDGFSLDPRDYFARKARNLPGFTMLTLLIGTNPINGAPVQATPANVIRAFIELMPGGGLIAEALDRYGVIDKAGAWLQEQIDGLGMSAAMFVDRIERLLDSIDILHPLDSAERLWDQAKEFLDRSWGRIKALAERAADTVITFIRESVLAPLANLAKDTRGWDLLCAVLGRNPITGVAVPPTAENLIGGFMKLIGQEEVWTRIVETRTIEKVHAWFKGAWETVRGFVAQIPDLARRAISLLGIRDLLDIPGALGKIAGVFGGFVGSFMRWGSAAVWNLLEIVVKAVKPEAWDYIVRTGAALKQILRDPLPFVRNLVAAAKLGFGMFSDHFGDHLKRALLEWLTGALPGVYIPKALTLREIAAFAMSALGITWANIRAKLVAAIGETAVAALETGFDIVVTLVREGPAAAWEKIKDQLSNLKDMAIDAIQGFVVDMVVQRAIPRLIAMFIPGAGFVAALASIYGTVQTLIAKIGRIAAAVRAFIDSIVAIAAGNISAAAGRVEQTLAGALSIAISLLAGFIGLGDVGARVMAILAKLRKPIDKAIDWLVSWIVRAGRALAGAAREGARRLLEWWRKRLPVSFGDDRHTLQFDGEGRDARFVMRSAPTLPSAFLERKYIEHKIAASKKGQYISETVKAEGDIKTAKDDIDAIDQSGAVPLRGDRRKDSDEIMQRMDEGFALVSANLSGAYTTWEIKDKSDRISGFTLTRGSFNEESRSDLRDQHRKLYPQMAHFVKEDGTLRRNMKLARRHVVSSADMVDHYEATLNGKTVAEAAHLVSQRAAIEEAREQVPDNATASVIKERATARYTKFFRYTNNLFIGASAPNSALGRTLDRDHPGLQSTALLRDHIARIKREWSFGGSFTISAVSKTEQIESDDKKITL